MRRWWDAEVPLDRWLDEHAGCCLGAIVAAVVLMAGVAWLLFLGAATP